MYGMNVFAKIFSQIFDSSISGDYVVRHIFMDLLVLADRDGVVDMTLDAISRRTNVPEEIVSHAICELMKPDTKSRSDNEEGRRIVPLDSHRDWGWQIVNFQHYRNIRDEESRRAYFRDKKREYRAAKSTGVHSVPECPQPSTTVLDSPTLSTQGEGEGEIKNIAPKKAQIETLYQLYPKHAGKIPAFKAIEKALKVKTFDELLLAVQSYVRLVARDHTAQEYIPYPATWFNAGRYDDDDVTNLKPKRKYTQGDWKNPADWLAAQIPEGDE